MNQAPPPDPDDLFSDTRMSFGDHIEDLRTHLIRAITCFLIGVVLCIYPLGTYVLAIIVAPVETQLDAFYKRAAKAQLDKVLNDPEQKKLLMGRGMKVEFSKRDLLVAMGLQKADQRDPLEGLYRGADYLLERLQIDNVLDPELYRPNDMVQIRVQPVNNEDWLRTLSRGVELIKPPQKLSTFNVMEALVVYVKVALLSGLVLSSPFVFWNIWMFIAAGLYPHEKRLVNVYLPFSLGLFLTGVLVCQFLVMPRAVEALLWFNEWLGFQPELRLNEWLNFALMMPLVFGISFQTPLVMIALNRLGMFTAQDYLARWRGACFGIAVFAAVITPTPDPITMMYLFVPMFGLYLFGVGVCHYFPGSLSVPLEEEAADEVAV